MVDHEFPYLRLRLTIRPEPKRHRGPLGCRPSSQHQRDGRPALSAARLRRILGKAFIDLFCPFGRPRCQDWPKLKGRRGPSKAHELCPQAKQCAYGVFFAASQSLRPPFALYVLPLNCARGTHRVEVTLFGHSWALYPWMLTGLGQALRGGVGKERRPWTIEKIEQLRGACAPRHLCGFDLTRLATDARPDAVPLTRAALLESFETQHTPSLGVQLLSPTRLLHDGRLLKGPAPVPFSILVARTLDRIRGLYADSTQNLLPTDLVPLLESEAAHVPIVQARTRWVEQKDYSARFRKELQLGGKVGNLVYGRGAGRFLPILRAGEILHVGKNVTSGCGRIAVGG